MKNIQRSKKEDQKNGEENFDINVVQIKLNLIYSDQLMGSIEKTSRIQMSLEKS
ncbi:unnamed protein product (macronuclear) [Paramecium tetraurelia]|uniref:Uncharacterized protein n=1 Tax=Paramecium tetraurelia TaxID=5888 RepID=A0BL71_PARTE|nr:uncharacterized protein GSPATT00029920001 [Paramecium tetraurelia]CAK59288.1 unnamed protein product [Paramecium tetraurelia]|eukprot:XP_001426686.1 hypothetical protein (macronuclear) [Paramecium tetraurelia strain d4-2]